jgi:hypothetical protein
MFTLVYLLIWVFIYYSIIKGTRDETNETSGSLLSIKNTYLKTVYILFRITYLLVSIQMKPLIMVWFKWQEDSSPWITIKKLHISKLIA